LVIFVTLAVFQPDRFKVLRLVLDLNILAIVVTLEVFQPDRFKLVRAGA